MVDGRVALLDQELDLLGVVGHGLGERGAEVLADEVGDERQVERGRAVGRPGEDRVVDERPQRGQGDEQHEGGQHEREEQELDDPAEAAAATATAPTAVAAVAVPARRLVGLGHVVGRVGVGLEPAALGLASVAWASAGADRHVGISGVEGWTWGSDAGRRVSRASCRMTAAASRSTRARYSSRWWRDGGPPERPRFIGPSRRLRDVAAQPLIVQGDRDMVAQSGADVLDPRPGQRGLRSFVPGRVDGQADDQLRDLVRSR